MGGGGGFIVVDILISKIKKTYQTSQEEVKTLGLLM
jgi:hypothetical protein